MKGQKLNTISLRQHSKSSELNPATTSNLLMQELSMDCSNSEKALRLQVRPTSSRPEVFRLRYFRGLTNSKCVTSPSTIGLETASSARGKQFETDRLRGHNPEHPTVGYKTHAAEQHSTLPEKRRTNDAVARLQSKTSPMMESAKRTISSARHEQPEGMRLSTTPLVYRLSSSGDKKVSNVPNEVSQRKGILNSVNGIHTFKTQKTTRSLEWDTKKKVTFKVQAFEDVPINSSALQSIHVKTKTDIYRQSQTIKSHQQPELLSDEPLILSQRNLELHNIVLSRRPEIPALVDLPKRSMTAVDKAAYFKVINWLDRNEPGDMPT